GPAQHRASRCRDGAFRRLRERLRHRRRTPPDAGVPAGPSMTARRGGLLLAAGVTVVASCGGGSERDIALNTAPTTPAVPDESSSASPSAPAGATVTVTVDVSKPGATISPAILGVSSALTADQLHQAGLTVNSWGGNPSTRYNYEIGHAWNQAADFEFRNTNYGDSGDSAQTYVQNNK